MHKKKSSTVQLRVATVDAAEYLQQTYTAANPLYTTPLFSDSIKTSAFA